MPLIRDRLAYVQKLRSYGPVVRVNVGLKPMVVINWDAELFPEPLRFDPDRWNPERPQPPRGAFIPFGVGKRMCIGDQFSLTEAVVITALVASRWRLRPAPGKTVRPIPEITVHPSSLDMIVEARKRAVVGAAA